MASEPVAGGPSTATPGPSNAWGRPRRRPRSGTARKAGRTRRTKRTKKTRGTRRIREARQTRETRRTQAREIQGTPRGLVGTARAPSPGPATAPNRVVRPEPVVVMPRPAPPDDGWGLLPHPRERSLVTPGRIRVSVHRPGPLTLLVRWRYELAVVALGYPMVRVGLGWTLVVVTAAAASLVLAPVRRAAVGRFWCVVTPHRVRTGCAQAWVHSRSGRLPAVLWTSPRPYGERVLLWCPAGTSPADLDAVAPLLAVACWARDVRVETHPEHANLVTVHVIRRGGRVG